VKDEKLKDPTDVANALNNFFITITERRCYLNAKRFISWKLPQH
jgi:hypothetical protein